MELEELISSSKIEPVRFGKKMLKSGFKTAPTLTMPKPTSEFEYANNLEIPPDAEPSEYYRMIMCHGISVGNELYYTKALISVGT